MRVRIPAMFQGIQLRFMLLFFCTFAFGCGEEPKGPRLSREPVSVRGWVGELDAGHDLFSTLEPNTANAMRKATLLGQATISVENSPFSSGGIGENGSFIILDVPPGNVTIVFQVPGIDESKLTLENLPGNSDVLLPALHVGKTTTALLHAKDAIVRVPSDEKKRRPLPNVNVKASGQPIPAFAVPMEELEDRREYPEPPNGLPKVLGIVR